MVAAVTRQTNHLPVVCQLLHGLRVGGAEVLAARIARRLGDEFRFVFVCLDELGGTLGEGLMAEGYPVHVVGRRPGIDWRCSWRLAPLLRRHHVALVHAHLFTPFFYGALARLLYARPPILFTDHGRPFPDHPNRKHLLANRVLLQRRDRVVGVGQAVREGLIRNEGFPAARVGVVYNGIDLPAFAGAAADRAAVRQELGLTEDEFAVLQVARLVPDKDHVTAVRAMERVVRERPDVRLLVVGEGPELPTIQDAVARLGLHCHVRLLGLRTDVPRLLAAADLFLLSSVTEGIPLTVIEAMAAGLAVVSPDVGGVSEVVVHGETGGLVPARDPDALAAMVVMLADIRSMRNRMGRAGRERAEKRFSETTMVAEYRRLYREMLRG
jgi:glycosyltransferase involved in cell wall biosynthesis